MARVFIGVGHGGKDQGAVANGLVESRVIWSWPCQCKKNW